MSPEERGKKGAARRGWEAAWWGPKKGEIGHWNGEKEDFFFCY